MESLYSKIIGTPVVVEGHTRPIHSVRELVLDPDNGALLAFVVDINRNKIIMPMDVLHWGSAIVVDDQDCVIDAEEVVKVQSILEDGRRYLNAKVESEEGDQMGSVFDLTLDLKKARVRNLYVAKGFLGLIRYQSRIIPADQIVEVLQDKIIVKANMQTVKDEETIPVQDAAMS